MPDNVKPGIKTTEWWGVLIIFAIPFIKKFTGIELPVDETVTAIVRGVEAVGAIIALIVYINARKAIKMGQ